MTGRKRERLVVAVMAVILSMALGVVVLGQGGIEQKVEFYLDGKIGSELVKKGSYKVVIPEGEQGTAEIVVGRKVISIPFTRRQNESGSNADKMTYRENSDGSRSIASITPKGRKFTLVLSDSGASVATRK